MVFGISDVGEGVFDYNLIRDGLLKGKYNNAYNFAEGVMFVGSVAGAEYCNSYYSMYKGTGSNTIKGFEAPKIYTNAKGQLTNGTYTIDSAGMASHTNGSTAGKSQFLFNIDANKAVLDAAAYADKYNLWSNGKAKVFIENGPIGVHGSTGQLTNWLNIYKTKTGFVHGAPGTP